MTTDPRSLDELRHAFPILEETTYLATHSLGAVPASAQTALSEYYETWASQGIQAWEGPWWEALEGFTASIEQLLGASAGTVAPMLNATRAMAGVLSALDWSGERNQIVTTDLEFTTSYPLLRGLEELGAELVVIKSEDGITVAPERITEAIDTHTRLVHTGHVYFRSGAIQDLAALTKAAHEEGAYLLADGYQALGCVPVDVQALGVDFYVGGSHKWLCGGPGAAFLYVRPEVTGRLRPRITGWFGLQDPFAYESGTGRGKPHPSALRFLAGTPNIPAFYAAREGIAHVQEAGMDRIRETGERLSQALVEEAQDRGYKIHGPVDPEARSPMVCLQFDGATWKHERLADRGVVVDHRPDSGMRISPHFYSTEEDLATFWETLDKV